MVGMAYLGGHDQFVVHDVVGCVPHPEEGARRVEVAWHARTAVDVFPKTLRKGQRETLVYYLGALCHLHTRVVIQPS